MKKGLVSLLIIILAFGAFGITAKADTGSKYWEYRTTITVTEKAGIPRLSHPIDVKLPMDNMNQDGSDIRVTDKNGNIVPFQITSKNPAGNLIEIRIGADIPKNGTEDYYVYYGNPDANKPLQTHAGVEKYLGKYFVTHAWGEVKISSYSKDNQITIEDENGNFIKDAKTKRTIAAEIYGPGSVRQFTLSEPTTLKIHTETGMCSVAVGNFGSKNGDMTAFIPNTSFCHLFIPDILAITSLHDQNTVRISARGSQYKNELLNKGQTLYVDGLSQTFCTVDTDKNCVIQYGSSPKTSLFSVPQKGLKYTYMPIGKVLVGAAFDDTKVDIIWSDKNKSPETFTMNAGEKKIFANGLPEKAEFMNATTIVSTRPITVLAMGSESTNNGATFLPSITANILGDTWNTFSGPSKPEGGSRKLWLMEPFSRGEVKETGSLFFEVTGEAVKTTPAELPGTHAKANFSVSETMLLLDGDPERKAGFFQVPASLDLSVSRTIGKPQKAKGVPGWTPEGAPDDVTPVDPEPEPDPEPEDKKTGYGISNFFKDIPNILRNPMGEGNIIPFLLILLFIFIIILGIVAIFVKFTGKNDDDDEFLKTDFDEIPRPLDKHGNFKRETVTEIEEIPATDKQEPTLSHKPTIAEPEPPEITEAVTPEKEEEPETTPEKIEEKIIEEVEPLTTEPVKEPLPEPPPAPKPPVKKTTPKKMTTPKKASDTGTFRTPKLRPPDITQFMTKKSAPKPEPKPTPKPEPEIIKPVVEQKPKPVKSAEPPAITPKPEPIPEKVDEKLFPEPVIEKSSLFDSVTDEQKIDEEIMEKVITPEPETEPPKVIPVTPKRESKIIKPVAVPPDTEIPVVAQVASDNESATTAQKELADKLNSGGLVADAGAIVRLHHDGLIGLFDKIYISHTATILLPEELLNDHRLEKITVMGKDAKRADKLSDEYGIFPEASRALVVAEKTKVKYYLTSAKLPMHMGKLNIIHVERFS